MTKTIKYSHTYYHTVSWGDMDSFGHVNNVIYARYFECARVDFFAKNNAWYQDEKITQGPVMIKQELVYRKQVRYPTTLEITLEITKKTSRNFEMSCSMWDESADCVMTAQASFFWFDFHKGKPIKIPDIIMKL